MTGVSVIIPTYNEAECIQDTLRGVQEAFAGYHSEVIVVDDDSPDGTADLVRDLHDGKVRCICRTDEAGLSSAVIRGMAAANGDVCAVMDADGQHPARAARATVDAVGAGADVAVGTRFRDGGSIAADWPAWRRIVSSGAAWIARWEIPAARGLSDPMSGLFAVDADVVDGHLDTLQPEGFKILLEILSRCPVDEVEECGYTFYPREDGESNLSKREYARFVRHVTRASVASRQDATLHRGEA